MTVVAYCNAQEHFTKLQMLIKDTAGTENVRSSDESKYAESIAIAVRKRGRPQLKAIMVG